MNKIMKKEVKDKALLLMSTNPDMDLNAIAKECGVTSRTLINWKNDPTFAEAMYEKYISTIGVHMPSVINSMVREAKMGNVQAARFVAEISGKLIKRISVKVESPFEKFMNFQKINDAEVLEVVDDMEITEDLPPRSSKNDHPNVRSAKERKMMKKAIKKGYKKEISQEQRAKNRKKSLESYRRMKRAKKVGMEPLGRRTGEAKRQWYAELERKEKEMK
jgi:hypothetical protein